MPLGPGPKRMMFVAPKMKPMMSPTAVNVVSYVCPCMGPFNPARNLHPPIIPPIFTAKALALNASLFPQRSLHTLVKGGLATSAARTSRDRRHVGPM